ncbi:hypothetical protein [Pseudomonas sp. AN-1]|uniref:hypothetical protein n=1 Tax=Pseudomonas sp. AN-1 TaxID=3096605 RepID=UPI002A6B5CA5|nr:hypothetical protein [Pseudomonas sp. AN-1]WPP46805.1 hypothetical protein SK095_05275 [Pseudomonas sp. AN-1]
MSQCSRIGRPAPWPLVETQHRYSTGALIDAAQADLGVIYVLDVFVNRLLSQGKLVELFPGW